MRRTTTGLMATAALIALAACSKNPKPGDLPPPPSATTTPQDGSASTGGVSGAALPGSRADFIAQAGTDTVHFGTDSSDVDGEAQSILTAQVAWLRRYPNVRATIEGHCDERGTREYNLALGERRANAAKNFLVGAGIDAGRLSVISYGKERPADAGSDESAWAQNRRAVTIVPQ